MKREILFRAKRIDNGEWVEGDLHVIDCKHPHIHCNGISYRIDVNTIGQFTGLTDKNGVQIFEEDILLDYEIELESQQDISGKFPVVYDSSKCQFSIDNSFKKDGSNLVNFVEYFDVENLEVVGNIHDNPELL